jgi:hypothetical protein
VTFTCLATKEDDEYTKKSANIQGNNGIPC